MPSGSIAEYFESTKEAFPYKDTVNVSVNGERTNFGNADEAYKYVYSYKYGDYDIASMQLLIKHGGKFFIFTYTSYGDITDETSYYRIYLDRAQKAIDNFLFTDKIPDSGDNPPEYTYDSEGYKLISDKNISGFELYVPDSFSVMDSSAIVSAKISEKSSISLTRATETGVNILSYLSKRHDDLVAISDSFTDIKVTVTTSYNESSSLFDEWNISVMPEIDSTLRFGDLNPKSIAAYEYKFTYGGTEYHVYQILGITRFDGFTFTYTATEDEYSAHLDEVMNIISKVKFN